MDLMKLLDILDEHFGDAELVALCRQFGVAFGAFPGESRRDKIREFLGFIKRQGRMAGLTETAIAQRPDLTTAIAELYAGKETELSWLDEVAGGSGQALDSGLTWRWTAGGARLSQTPAPTPGPLDDATNAPLPDPEPPIPTVMINPYTPGNESTTMRCSSAVKRSKRRSRVNCWRVLTSPLSVPGPWAVHPCCIISLRQWRRVKLFWWPTSI